MSSLVVTGLTLTAPGGKRLCTSLSFSVRPGKVLALMGASGSGKSSILGWLTGTLAPGFQSHGTVYLGDTKLNTVPTEQRRMGLMLQQDYLFPHMSVAQNLKFGLLGGSSRERQQRVIDSLQRAGLDGLADRHPSTLSGGQRARVSLLRTLFANPQAVLLDEPFSRLDSERRDQIRQFTWAACAQLPVLLVSHDKQDIPANAQVIVLSNIDPIEDRKATT